MGSSIVFWIVCGCLIFSLCESLWRSFRAIRKSETKQDVSDRWCGLIDNVFVYSAFIALYATESFGYIYDYVYEYFYWHLGWRHFVWSEGAFLLAVIIIWLLASLPASILRVITSPGRTKEVLKEEYSELYKLVLAPFGIGYMFLIEAGPVWALIPFLLGLITLVASIIKANNNFRHMITWRVMLWTSIQAIVVLGVGITLRELMQCWQFSEAMGLYDYSYAANLISVVIICSVAFEFLIAADEYFKPTMYLPMSPYNIEDWKEKHQVELSGKKLGKKTTKITQIQNRRMNNKINESKRLAHLLRHSDLPDSKGWVKTSVVLGRLSLLPQDLQQIVEGDSKGRFEFSVDKSSVRALYGHSIDVNLGLEATMPPLVLYHGTAEKYVDSIMKEGLRPRKRNFVHLSETIDMAKQIGARHGSPVVLSIDTEAMIRAGYKFYKAQNGIWLTGDILPKFFKAVYYK